MAFLFKQKIVRYVNSAGQRVRKDAPGAKRIVEKSRKWYGRFIDEEGRERREAFSADKSVALAMLGDKIRKIERLKAGYAEPSDQPKVKAIEEHLKDYRGYLESKGDTEQHVAKTISRITRILEACRISRVSQISAVRVANYLSDRKKAGLGIKTANYYLTAMKGFVNWLVREQYLSSNPIGHLQGVNPKMDVRVQRRTLSPAEFERLIQATREKGENYRGLSGTDRALLYRFAAETGLRASELASLTFSSLDLDGVPPTVRVEAGYSKRRREDVQPFRVQLVPLLREWKETRTEQDAQETGELKLWPGTWATRGAEMLRADLVLANIPCKDAAGRVFDFHSLRHQFITSLAKAGVHPRVAQQLARHSTIQLTMEAYTHLQVADLGKALENLPEIPDATTGELDESPGRPPFS